MSTSNEQISTEDLFRRALEASSRAQNLPSMKDETQVSGETQAKPLVPLIASYATNPSWNVNVYDDRAFRP